MTAPEATWVLWVLQEDGWHPWMSATPMSTCTGKEFWEMFLRARGDEDMEGRYYRILPAGRKPRGAR